ncbi:MAG: tight adherence protein [Pseudonocardiales bacterium]|nr:tight adherence protein [Pseudonocardiales bacterium]
MVTLAPALACVALAFVATAVPGAPGAARLRHLGGRPALTAPSRRLPAAAAIGVGALAGLLALGPAGGVAGGFAALVYQRRRVRSSASREATAMATELADALGRITEELQAGAHPVAALGGTGADGPLARALLAPAAAAATLGDGVPAALATEAGRRPGVARDLSRIARSWALAERHGVPPVELLVAVHADMRWRVAQAARVRAQLAGPRATAAVLSALPVLGIALGELVGAGPLAVLRSGVLGQLLVVVGVGLAATGAAWTGHILRGAVPR